MSASRPTPAAGIGVLLLLALVVVVLVVFGHREPADMTPPEGPAVSSVLPERPAPRHTEPPFS